MGKGEREGWCWASHFYARAVRVVICVHGRSFSFMVRVVVSWALIISEWGVIVICGGLLLPLSVVICGHGCCLWGWAVVCGHCVIVCGCWVSLRGTRLSFGGGRCHLWHHIVVLGWVGIISWPVIVIHMWGAAVSSCCCHAVLFVWLPSHCVSDMAPASGVRREWGTDGYLLEQT